MNIFKKSKRVMPIPVGFTKDDIKIESSICTGEKTIGFYSKEKRKLVHEELVSDDKDIKAFYEQYGIERRE